MKQKEWRAALRSAPALTVLAAVLVGCGGGAPARYGGGYDGRAGYYGGPGAYGSPYGSYGYRPYGGYDRYGSRGYYGPRGGYDRAPSPPRAENWSQNRLQQHWLDQARRAR